MTDLRGRLQPALADRYALEREIGHGGMATVFLAQDIRHDRKVALKVLKPELAAVIGAERFLSEIRTTANLQHPHVLPLFDSGMVESRGGRDADAQGLSTPSTFLYYVMPFVEGESLRDRLTRENQLPIRDAVRIATEVASALDYAHRHHIIHRDIKPENILLHDGRAVVADFGIALAASTAGGRMTETGMSLGTPTYMSPEQAMGERAIDGRADIYALGCVTYEMLVGDPPFLGSSAQAIIAKVMTEKPAPPSRTRDRIPPAVEDAVLTAIEKLPADRFATAGEFAAALAGEGPARPTGGVPRDRVPERPVWRRVSAVLGVLTLGLAAFSAWAISRPGAGDGPAVYDAALPDSAPMTFAGAAMGSNYGFSLRNLAVAPSGEFVVYAAARGDSTMLWHRSLRNASAHPIAGTSGASVPRLSPDGSQVAYVVNGRVMLVNVGGGEPRRLHDGLTVNFLGWTGPRSVIALDLDGVRVVRIDTEGGQTQSSTLAACGFGDWLPESGYFLCARNGVAIVADPESGERWLVRYRRPDGSAGDPVIGTGFRVVDGRYIVFGGMDGELRAAPYDAERRLVGRPVSLVAGMRRETIGELQFDLTSGGTLVYATGADAVNGEVVRLGPGGVPTALPIASAAFQRLDLSRDGRWLAAAVMTAAGQELRVYDLRTGQQATWLRGEGIRHAIWSPSGDRLLVGVRDGDRWSVIMGVPGIGMTADTLYSTPVLEANFDPIAWSGDTVAVAQDWFAFTASRFNPLARPARFERIASGARFVSLSPDGRLMAYNDEAGRVVVAGAQSGSRGWQVGSQGAEPLWLSQSEVLFRSGVSWFLARIDPRTGEPAGAPTLWARDPRFSDTAGWSNRPSHDGGILYLQGPEQTGTTYLRVIPGWTSQMRRAVDAANR